MAITGKIDYAPDFLKNLANGAGYDSNSAIAELVDNSMGAFSEIIKITAKNGRFKIEDYGENAGMDEKTLIKNFFFGGNSSTKGIEEAAGKFGVGGKTGIITIIGNNMDADAEITSHKKGAKPIYANWEVKRGRSNTYTYDFLNDDTIPYGTTIEFDYDNDIKIEEFIDFASVVYCWAINNGTKLYINDVFITPNDPLYRNNKNVTEKGLFTSKSFNVEGKNVEVNVTSFNCGNIIPEEELHSWDKGRGKTKSVLTANRSGIYVRTEGRYYTLGNNFDKIMGGTAHASLDGLRIEVCIPKSLWKTIGITWNKGKEITPFTKINSFNTGDVETGVADYIYSIMSSFKNNKETTDVKSASKITKVVDEIISDYNVESIKINVFASNTQKGKFVEYKDSTLFFDISHTSMRIKEIVGIVIGLSITIDTILKNENINLIENIVERFNK